MKTLKKLLLSIALVLTSAAFIPSAQATEGDQDFSGETVTIGTVGSELADIWEFVADKAAEEGITLEIVVLTDYNTPNISLLDGSLDMNAYQHTDFLNDWNESNDTNLTAIGTTFATPFRFFSENIESIDDLPDGAKIAIPNDLASSSYALQILEFAELIKLDESLEELPTINDIVENPKNLKIIELEAAQIPATLLDVDLGVIHQVYLDATDFEPKDAVYSYGHTPETFNFNRLNTITVREEDQDNPLYQHIVSLYQSDDVADFIEELSNDGHIPAWDLVKDMEENKDTE